MVKNLVANDSIERLISKRQFRNATLLDLHGRVVSESLFGNLLHARVQLPAVHLANPTAKFGQTTARPAASVQNRLLAQWSRRGCQIIEDDRQADRDSRVVIAAGRAVVILVFDSMRSVALTAGILIDNFHIHLHKCCFNCG